MQLKTSTPGTMLTGLSGKNGGLPVVRQVPMWPGPDEVLVRMAAAPIKGTTSLTRVEKI